MSNRIQVKNDVFPTIGASGAGDAIPVVRGRQSSIDRARVKKSSPPKLPDFSATDRPG